VSRPIALVTGASRGIGRAIAVRLSRSYDVVALARSQPLLHELTREIHRAGGSCRAVIADVARAPEVADALEGVDADILINNAGVMFRKPLVELAPSEWHAMVDVNLNALYHVTRAVLPGMLERGRGHVINIASIAGRSAFAGGVGYTATKHATLGFSESLMLEVRDQGVKVSVVMPGSVATDLGGGRGDDSWKLRPDDVAEVVEHILATPGHALVYQVEVRAARPKK
jgi:3-oxoacyl-[acyl-carrier protein] reductase